MRNQVKPKQIVFVAAVALFGFKSAAAEWELDPVIRAAWDYDDNAALSVRTDQEEEISGVIGEISVDFRNNGEKGFVSLRPMFRTRNYGSDSNRDSDDEFLDLRASYNGVRNSFRFFSNYARESVRTAELADAELDTDIDPSDIADDDTGRVINEETFTDFCAGIDIHTRACMRPLAHHARNDRSIELIQLMCESMCRDGQQTGVG